MNQSTVKEHDFPYFALLLCFCNEGCKTKGWVYICAQICLMYLWTPNQYGSQLPSWNSSLYGFWYPVSLLSVPTAKDLVLLHRLIAWTSGSCCNTQLQTSFFKPKDSFMCPILLHMSYTSIRHPSFKLALVPTFWFSLQLLLDGCRRCRHAWQH